MRLRVVLSRTVRLGEYEDDGCSLKPGNHVKIKAFLNPVMHTQTMPGEDFSSSLRHSTCWLLACTESRKGSNGV